MAILSDPFDALFQFQQALDAFRTSSWLGSGLSSGGAYPPLNVFRKGDDIVVIIEVPGVRSILGALAAEGYAAPTPIQFQAIPPVLGGRDLCGLEKLTRCSLRAIPSKIHAARNDSIERQAKATLPRDAGLASRQAPAREPPRRRSLPPPTFGAETRLLPVHFGHSCAARRQPNLDR